MEKLREDLRYTFRMLVKSPATSAVILLSLALGIGVSTTIFSAINAILVEALPVENPATLAAVFTTDARLAGGPYPELLPMSRLNFEDYRDRGEAFDELVLGAGVQAALVSGEGDPESVEGQMVTGNYFDVLGVEPLHGRTFLPEEDETPGSHPVAVLSYGLWSRRFGTDPDVVGREIVLNRHSFTVIGVAPRGFRGTFVLDDPDFWVPLMMHDVFLTGGIRRWYDSRRALLFPICFGRLRAGVGLAPAEAAMQSLGRALEEEYPAENKGRNVSLLPLLQATVSPGLRQNFVRTAEVMMVAVGLVLMIACANVASLLLGRASARRREIAVRLSLGAPRSRLIRQLLTESMALAVLAGSLGLLLAHWGRGLLWALRPSFLEHTILDLPFDARVLGLTLAVTAATGLLFGLAPVLQSTRTNLVPALKDQEEGTRRPPALRFGSLLVVGQIALALLALVASGLFLRNLDAARNVDLGFDPVGLFTMTFDLGTQGYDEDRGRQFFDQVVERAANLPGVAAASLSSGVPLHRRDFQRTVFIAGRPRDAEGNGVPVVAGSVGIDYFKTAGIPLLRGREFDRSDRQDTALVAVISEAMADRFWPGEDALDRHFEFIREEGVQRQVVGIVGNSQYSLLGEEPQALIYLPRQQVFRQRMALFVRTTAEPVATMASVREELQLFDRNLPISDLLTMREIVDEFLWTPRAMARLLAAFGLLALLLAAVGTYGVMSHSVSRRRREIGIRMALGARRRSVFTLVCRRGLALAAVGMAIGLAAAWVLTAIYRGPLLELLYASELWQWQSLVPGAALVAVVALVANLVPARRASEVDPIEVLRYE